MTVKELSALSGIGVITLHEGAKQNKFPFMTAFRKEGNKNWTYVVFDKIAEEYFGGKK